MKKTLCAVLLVVAALGVLALLSPTPANAAKGSCVNVRCATCPDGYHLRVQWPYCCQCIPN
jgi:hypothetical protein